MNDYLFKAYNTYKNAFSADIKNHIGLNTSREIPLNISYKLEEEGSPRMVTKTIKRLIITNGDCLVCSTYQTDGEDTTETICELLRDLSMDELFKIAEKI